MLEDIASTDDIFFRGKTAPGTRMSMSRTLTKGKQRTFLHYQGNGLQIHYKWHSGKCCGLRVECKITDRVFTGLILQ